MGGAGRHDERFVDPADVAEIAWQLTQQSREACSFEIVAIVRESQVALLAWTDVAASGA